MKFCYNTNLTLPKQSQISRSVLQDRSRSLGLFWKEKAPSYNRRNTVNEEPFTQWSSLRHETHFGEEWGGKVGGRGRVVDAKMVIEC